MPLTSWAEFHAARLLSPLGNRWVHVRQVAAQARSIANAIDPADEDLLVAAAYLHDIGYAPQLAITGFHPLDGARWVRDNGKDRRLARLVAHHSCAIHEARVRGLDEILLREFEPEDSPLYDALVYCDMTVGPAGETVTIERRLSEVAKRYGPGHAVTSALDTGRPHLTLCYSRTLNRLQEAELN